MLLTFGEHMEFLTQFETQSWILVFLSLAVFRIYLEVIKFDFATLPISKGMGKSNSHRVHKFGFYMSIGYFVMFAPGYILS